jgi:copper resistance protein D
MALLPYFRALHIAACVLIGGAVAFEILILDRARLHDDVSATVRRWLIRLAAWGIVIGLVSWVGWLVEIAVAMSGLPTSQALAPDVVRTVISKTTFGNVWMIRLGLFAALAALTAVRRAATRLGAATYFLLALALVGSLAWTGHALGTNRVHVWVDAMHLVAATVWLGMLPPLLLVTSKAVTHAGSWRDLATASARNFFVPGVLAVLLLAASGVANTSWMLNSVSDLANTTYGRVLSVKLALFALMLMVALANRLVIVPRVEQAADAASALRSLRTSVLAELLLGAAIVAVVAWLGITPPVGHQHMMHQQDHQGM